MKKDALIVLIIFLSSTTLLISQNQEKVNTTTTNKETLQDSSVVLPESLNDNLSHLLHNWQIDFSKSPSQCNKGVNIAYTDSVYMKRLYDLPTIMELSFNPVVRTYIEMYTNKRRDLVSYMLSLGDYYYPMFEEALDRYGLPLELKYLPVIESALNPVAVSRMGATGLWQFMLRTGRQYKLEVNSLVDERRDPYKSTDAAAQYLRDLYQIYEDWNLVIAAYNCGPGNVNKAIARSGGQRDYWDIYYNLPRETRGYVPAFIAANYVMNYNDEHRICHQETSNELIALDTVHVDREVHFQQISAILEIPIESIRRYNPQFKRDLIPGNHKPYALVLPTKEMYAFISHKDEIVNHNRSVYMTNRMQTLTNLNDETALSGNVLNTYYRIKKGDTLGAIARRNGTTVGRLQRMNGMRSTKLSIGKRIIVKQIAKPVEVQEDNQDGKSNASTGEVENTYYRVKRGDTLGGIARRNGTTVAQLQRMNRMNTSKIAIGKNLVVQQKAVPVPEINVDTSASEEKYQRIELSPSTSSENIITEYLKKKKEESKDNT
ncbi:MAG: transglycosylase SLT domain-containing protein [Dysgonamonadaceae bacterium]|nr:transglycosylase SLT domain-containing protein [Dysgonamonadaceae bacterium]MDD4729091.1 transglycosylase SLT domain-containing protein [Dysgonamonadaceae bacterium]